MAYSVIIKKKAEKGLRKMPADIQKRMAFLIDDLTEDGPVANTGRATASSQIPNTIVIYPTTGWLAGAWRRKR